MTRKRKIRLIVIMPVMITMLIVGGLLTFVLILGSAGRHALADASGVSSGSEGSGAVAAATASETIPAVTGGVAPACDFPKWIGKPVDLDAVARTHEAYRVIKPGEAVTDDYSATRLNIELDAQGNVRGVHCG